MVIPCRAEWKLYFQPRQRLVSATASNEKQIFIGTPEGVFVKNIGEESFIDFNSGMIPKDENGFIYVNWIFLEKEKIFIATNTGVYYSKINKPKWDVFFEGNKTESRKISSVNVINSKVYVSSDDGLWICDENKNCRRDNQGLSSNIENGNYENNYVLKIKDVLFSLTNTGVYKKKYKDEKWKKIEGINFLPNGNADCNHLFLNEGKELWLAAKTGAYLFDGKRFVQKSYGLKSNQDGLKEVFFFSDYKDLLCSGTAQGVYCFDGSVWNDFSEGLRSREGLKDVFSLLESSDGFYAATREGLFKYIEKNSLPEKVVLKGKVESGFANLEDMEPTLVEVQEQALRFASLPTEKEYKKYRLQARLRNLLPRVDLSLSRDVDNSTFFQNDRGLSTDSGFENEFDAGEIARTQDDDRSFGGLSVTWNASELIYDDEIVDILSQARLTANIKENLLDDVTRIYFQRRRLQLGGLLSPPKDISSRLESKIQISELTGQLDSRTGGWFSKEIEKRKKKI